jgi:putative membrane protein
VADQGAQPHRFEVRPTSDSHFAWLRTRLALERTLMSWVRTSVALIGFGFTIVQFFERLHSMDDVAPLFDLRRRGIWASRSLRPACSAGDFDLAMRYLSSKEFDPIAGIEVVRVTPLYVISIAIIFIGLFAFGAVQISAL